MAGPHPFPPVNTWGFTQHNPFQAVYDTQPPQRLPDDAANAAPSVPGPVRRPRPQRQHRPARRRRRCRRRPCIFLNDPFVHEQADRFAARLLQGAADDGQRIDLAYRHPVRPAGDVEETHTGETFLRRYAQGLKDAGVAPDKQSEAAWASFARVLFARNEFIYID